MNCVFISDDKLIACGYDKVPYLYTKDGNDWKLEKTLDDGLSKKRDAKVKGLAFKGEKIYFNKDMKLSGSVECKETNTKHVNYINCLKVYA